MRSDFAQLLVQTPRSKSRYDYRIVRRTTPIDDDDTARAEGMRRPHRDRKSFGEYFNPMLRMLHKNVGRPWSKVYSELCTALRGGNTVIEHAKLHLRGYVEENPIWRDGKPYHARNWYMVRRPIGPGWFYVDRCGFLREGKRYRESDVTGDITVVMYTEHDGYVKHNGAWWDVHFTRHKRNDGEPPPLDVLMGKLPGDVWHAQRALRQKYGCKHGEEIYATGKRQLSSREIKRLNLPRS